MAAAGLLAPLRDARLRASPRWSRFVVSQAAGPGSASSAGSATRPAGRRRPARVDSAGAHRTGAAAHRALHLDPPRGGKQRRRGHRARTGRRRGSSPADSRAATSSAIRAAKTSPSSRELDASRFAPWTPVHEHSPHAYRPSRRRATEQVGLDPARGVVLGRGHREQLGGGVDAELAAPRDDRREARARGTPPRGGGHRARRAPSPRSAMTSRMARATTSRGARSASGWRPCHEAAAGVVDEDGPLAAHRLGDQRLLTGGPLAEEQHRRVELDELEVGDPRAGPQRRRHPVAGRHRRVGRRGVDLAEPAGREHDRPPEGGADAVDLPLPDDVQRHAADGAVGGRAEVDDEGVLDDLDAGVARDRVERGDEGARDLRARGVTAGVGDPVAVVAALAGQLDLALRRRGRSRRRARRARGPARAPR